MMRRVFWLGVGAAVGVIVVRKASKAVSVYSPRSLARSAGACAGGLLGSARSFADEVRAGMAEHEAQLLAAIVPDQPPTPLA